MEQVDGRQGTWITTPAPGTATVENGALHAVTTTGSWASLSTVIANGECYDASAYTGISFRIMSPTNTSIIFVVPTADTATDYSHWRPPVITVTSDWTTVEVPFSSLGPPPWGAGMELPPDYDPSIQMTAIGFGVGVETELLDLYIDDVTFY